MSPAGIRPTAHRGLRRPRRVALPLSRPAVRIGLGVLAGLFIALGLPPWGWWPLSIVGTAGLSLLTDTPSRRGRFFVGIAVGIAWLGMGMAWMWFLTPPGYVVATIAFASLHGIAALLTPTTTNRIWLGPLCHTAAEALRWWFPFGGVPLATLPIAASGSPLLGVSRLGGPVLLCWLMFQLGAAIAAMRAPRTAIAPTIASAIVVVAAAIAPRGTDTGFRPLVAAVQGGGEQGTSALDVPPEEVFNVHLQATNTIENGATDRTGKEVSFVVWPENGIHVTHGTEFAGSDLNAALVAEANRLGIPLVVGLTEDDDFSNHPNPTESFVNAQLVVYPDGTIGDRYEKVQIVPFGEYVPLRGLLSQMGVDLSLIPLDATRGQDPAQLRVELAADTEAADGEPTEVTLGVMISWEVFFSHRGRDAASNGAEILLNPTNGSSYTWTILQTQQVASSKLRAAENGRWVVQDSPTGFSAFIDPDGTVYQRTNVSEQAVIYHIVPARTGSTLYHRTGDRFWIALLALAWLGFALTARRNLAKGREPPDDHST